MSHSNMLDVTITSDLVLILFFQQTTPITPPTIATKPPTDAPTISPKELEDEPEESLWG